MADDRVDRRLAAILAADVAGYSRLTGADEEGTMRRLRALRTELIDPAIQTNRGRVFHTAGDSILIEFASVVDAVRCSLDVQRGMAVRNADFMPEKRIEFRVGIHLGDVMVQPDGDLLGDGVNIAARLEGVAEPGGICLSNSAYDQVRDKVDEQFIDLGDRQLKNIARPVRVYRIDPKGASTSVTPEAAKPALALPDKPSIAVLPFTNMSGDPEQDYFCDGMVEDITTALSRFRWLFVIARNSSFTFKAKAVDVKQVGRELGVRYVLEGSVRKAGNRVRVTGQLIEAATGTHLWAERYDRSLADIFALQDEIVVAIIGTLVPEIGLAERQRALRKPPHSLDAWDVFVRGLNWFYRFGKDDFAEAQKLFDRATELDPAYSDAYAMRAFAGLAEILFGYAASPHDVLIEATRFAQRALQLDDRNALGHTILGRSLMLAGRHDDAIAESRLAIEFNPNLATAHYGLGFALGWAGRLEEGRSHIEQALRLSPRDPLSPIWRNTMCIGLSLMGNDGAALEANDAALRQRPDNPLFLAMRALPLVGLGRLDDARAAVANAIARNPGVTLRSVVQSLPNVHHRYLDIVLDRLRQAGLPE